MKLPGLADETTLGLLFKACQIELINSGKTKGMSREEIFKAAGELLDEVIAKTQVVDSTVTRSQIMRSGGLFTKNATNFMSEPTVSYNQLLRSTFAMQHDLRSGMKFKDATAKNGRQIKKALLSYTATSIAAAVMETIFAGLRDKEDDELLEDLAKIPKNFAVKFAENMIPINKIPLIKEVWSTVLNTLLKKQSYSDNAEYEGVNSAIEAAGAVVKLLNQKGATWEQVYSTIKDSLKAFSYLSGLPIYNAVRDIESIWNSIGARITGFTLDMKETSASEQIKKSYDKKDFSSTVNNLIEEKFEKLKKEKPNASSEDLSKEAKSSVKSSATHFFKEEYLTAYKKGKTDRENEILSAMRKSGLYDDVSETVEKWVEAYEEDLREQG